jgi:hypothetical protein
MKYFINTLIALAFVCGANAQEKAAKTSNVTSTINITKEALKDKIMGGWAGQTIGVTFGGPTEFRFNGTMIQ